MKRRCSTGSGRSVRRLLRLRTEFRVERFVACFPSLGGLRERGALDVARSRDRGVGVGHVNFA